MDLIKRNRRQYCNILLVLCLMFQMSVINTPIQASTGSVNLLGLGNPGAVKYAPVPVKNGEKVNFITALTGNEAINEIEINFFINRIGLGFKGLMLRIFRLPLPFTGLGVLVLCFGYVINKKDQHKSILAFQLGGHSPPRGLQLVYAS